MDVNEEVKFFCENSKKKKIYVGVRLGWGVRLGVRLDVNEELKFL